MSERDSAGGLVASANLDLVRSIYAEWERGDFSSTAWAHPEIEFVFAGGPSPGRWTGLAGMAEGFGDFVRAWDGFRVEADEFRELDAERVLVLSHFGGRGKTSGVDLGQIRTKGSEMFRIRSGKVTRLVIYWSFEQAIRDAGLASEGGSAEASVEVVRRFIRAWSERDFELAQAGFDPEVTGSYEDPFSGPVTFRGCDEVRAWWERIAYSWERLEGQIEEVIEARADLVVLGVRFKARGKDSGAVVEGQEQFQVWRLRDGKIVSFEFFADKEQALAAARSTEGPNTEDGGAVSPLERAASRMSRPGGDVTVALSDDFVATVEIHRPPDNYFDTALIAALADAYESLDGDPRCRAIVLCSEGKHFCAGARLGGAAEAASNERLGTRDVYREAVRLFAAGSPVVAAVQGAAVGGGLGLALSADFRVASPDTRFWANFARLGFHHGFGMTVTLPALVGQQVALDLLYTGRRVRGEEALSLGLCDRLVSAEQVRAEAHALAAEIAASAPLAVRSIRQTLRADLTERVGAAMQREQAEQHRLMQTDDFREGVQAASERRDPEFGGR